MHRALRPYVTTGIAIVGASVIAVAPIQPTPPDIMVPNPTAQQDTRVSLAANEIEDFVNDFVFLGTDVFVSLAKLPAPLVAVLLGIDTDEAEALITLGSLGLGGPLISGPGAGGSALQDIVDQLGQGGDLASLVNALIGAPATLINGLVNGNFGPNVGELLGIPAEFRSVLAGGLINLGNLNPMSPNQLIVPGSFPTLQLLVDQLLGQLTGEDEAFASLVVDEPGDIETLVNSLVFFGAQITVSLAKLAAPIVAPILDIDTDQAELFLASGALGLFGPLISGPGAVGAAIQDIVDQLGEGDLGALTNALIGAPATVIDGFVNGGGYGPNLAELIGAPPEFVTVLAGGLISPASPGETLIGLPGTIPTIQQLVQQLFQIVNPPPEPEDELMNFNSVDDTNLRTVELTTTTTGDDETVVDEHEDAQLLVEEGQGDDGQDSQQEEAKPKPKKKKFNPIGSAFRVVGGVLKAITPGGREDADDETDTTTTDTNTPGDNDNNGVGADDGTNPPGGDDEDGDNGDGDGGDGDGGGGGGENG